MKKTTKKDTTKSTRKAKVIAVPLPKLVAARKAKGLSQDKLGAEIGCTGSQIDRIEKGENELSYTRLLKICAALNVGADEILDLPLSGTAASGSCDKALLGTIVDTIIETANSLQVSVSGEEVGKWSAYAYDEVLADNLNFKQTKALAEQVVKIQTKLHT